MCAVEQAYIRIYTLHAGQQGKRHEWLVKQARTLLNEHRAHCPECRTFDRSNFNLRQPKRLAHFAPRG